MSEYSEEEELGPKATRHGDRQYLGPGFKSRTAND